jgi:hypothetical protein
LGLVTGSPVGEQLLSSLSLALQPGQARLLIHPGDLLASRQPLTHDRDELAVAAAFWTSTQLGSSSRLARIWSRVMGG